VRDVAHFASVIALKSPVLRNNRKVPPVSNNQLRQDFFEAAETLVPVVEGNKRKLIPARAAIEKTAGSQGRLGRHEGDL